METEEKLRKYCEEVKKEIAKTDFSPETKDKLVEFLVSQRELELSNTITEVIASKEEEERDLDPARETIFRI